MIKKEFVTESNIPIKSFYSQEDIKTQVSTPGVFPYTRGIDSEMYRRSPWFMGTYSGFGSAEETNKRYKYLLDKGQPSLIVACDLPTQMGLDSDHPMAQGEVGRVGVAIDSLADMETLFQGIDFSMVKQIGTTSIPGPLALALFAAIVQKKGGDLNNIVIRLQNDVLKEYVSRGTYIFPPGPSVELVVDTIEYAIKKKTKWVPLVVSGYHMREAGASAIEEVAFTMANAIEYINSAIKRGLQVDEITSRLWVFLGGGLDIFEEIAKFRAFRRIWANILKERYGVSSEDALKCRIQGYTMGSLLTGQQPLNNIIRVAIQTLVQVLGGVQTIFSSGYDEALGLPSEEAVRIAFNTQKIIEHETGIINTADPLGGSYYLEQLTQIIEESAYEVLHTIDNLGGAVAAIESGYIEEKIAEGAYEQQKKINNKEKIVVGVNQYKLDSPEEMSVFTVDPRTEEVQIQRIEELKKRRNSDAVIASLKELKEASIRKQNIVPYALNAVNSYATIGEICDVLREVYGTYKAPVKF